MHFSTYEKEVFSSVKKLFSVSESFKVDTFIDINR